MKHDGIPAHVQGSIPCKACGQPGTLSSDERGLRVEHVGRRFPCRQAPDAWEAWCFDLGATEWPAVLRPASSIPVERRGAP